MSVTVARSDSSEVSCTASSGPLLGMDLIFLLSSFSRAAGVGRHLFSSFFKGGCQYRNLGPVFEDSDSFRSKIKDVDSLANVKADPWQKRQECPELSSRIKSALLAPAFLDSAEGLQSNLSCSSHYCAL